MSVKEWSTINPHWLIDWYIPYLMSPITYKTRSRWERQELERKTKKCQAHSNWITNQARVFKPKKKNEWHTSTTTTPSKIPLTRGLRRSECRQPYPCKYHYSQRGRMPHIKWTKFIEWNPLAQKAHVPSFKSILGGGRGGWRSVVLSHIPSYWVCFQHSYSRRGILNPCKFLWVLRVFWAALCTRSLPQSLQVCMCIPVRVIFTVYSCILRHFSASISWWWWLCPHSNCL